MAMLEIISQDYKREYLSIAEARASKDRRTFMDPAAAGGPTSSCTQAWLVRVSLNLDHGWP
jgi:hypothetical protein